MLLSPRCLLLLLQTQGQTCLEHLILFPNLGYLCPDQGASSRQSKG